MSISRLPFASVLLVLAATATAAPRNVVLIVTDDQGLHAGCYGDPLVKTPAMDRLAAEGTRFTRAFCTTASCSPSRSVILTGLYNHANGQYGLQHAAHNFSTRRHVETLPALLRAAGYRTGRFGKFHVQPEEIYPFDVARPDTALPKMVENAAVFLKEGDQRPFFLYFCPTEPHRKARGFGNPRGSPRYLPKDVPVPAFLPDCPEVREEIADYYQAITRVDAAIGKLLNAIRETGHWDDTLILFVSDNGMPFPGAKTTLYDSGTHLPLIVRSPAQTGRGGTCSALVTWADLTPTILEWTKAKPPSEPRHGRSFLGVIDTFDSPGWNEIYLSHTFHEVTMYYPMRAVRTERYKLILNIAHALEWPFASDLWGSRTWQGMLERTDQTSGVRNVEAFLHRPRIELYDLENDPHEARNLADARELASVRKELEEKLRAWQEKTQDPWAIKYRHE